VNNMDAKSQLRSSIQLNSQKGREHSYGASPIEASNSHCRRYWTLQLAYHVSAAGRGHSAGAGTRAARMDQQRPHYKKAAVGNFPSFRRTGVHREAVCCIFHCPYWAGRARFDSASALKQEWMNIEICYTFGTHNADSSTVLLKTIRKSAALQFFVQ
jgi:hypothetical protein